MHRGVENTLLFGGQIFCAYYCWFISTHNTDIVFIIRNVKRTLFLLIVSAPPAHVTLNAQFKYRVSNCVIIAIITNLL